MSCGHTEVHARNLLPYVKKLSVLGEGEVTGLDEEFMVSVLVCWCVREGGREGGKKEEKRREEVRKEEAQKDEEGGRGGRGGGR